MTPSIKKRASNININQTSAGHLRILSSQRRMHHGPTIVPSLDFRCWLLMRAVCLGPAWSMGFRSVTKFTGHRATSKARGGAWVDPHGAWLPLRTPIGQRVALYKERQHLAGSLNWPSSVPHTHLSVPPVKPVVSYKSCVPQEKKWPKSSAFPSCWCWSPSSSASPSAQWPIPSSTIR